MHLILAIFIALVLFRWVTTKPVRWLPPRPLRGEIEITVRRVE